MIWSRIASAAELVTGDSANAASQTVDNTAEPVAGETEQLSKWSQK